jgi:hypothetical protein
MAEIVQSLFGVSPESYQQAQQQRADAQALQYAKLDPFQQANYAIGRGAYGLAGAIGGALGGQDPELQRITLRQQIASQIDFTDPASIQQGMNALGDDVMGKQQLAQIYRQQQESGALIGQRNAAAQASIAAANRERAAPAAPTTADLTNARAIAALAGPEGSPEYNAAFNAEYQRLTAKEPKEPKGPAFGADAERASKAKFGKPFADLTSAEAAEVDKDLEARGLSRAKATAPTLVLPGQPVPPKDWMAFTQNVLSKDPVMQRTSSILSDAPSAIQVIRASTDNDISAASLPGVLARLTGKDSSMSNQDINRFARTGGLDDRLAGDAVKFFTGKATNVKKDQAEKFAVSLYRGALLERKKKLTEEAEQYGYLDSPNYKSALQQIDNNLSQFKLAPKPGAAAQATPAQAGKLSDADLRKKYGVPE